MTYTQALDYIHKTVWLGSKPGLSRTKELLTKLGRPDKGLKIVHVAGTNGKGSTSACIASILKCAGYRTGLYTSPYITHFNERFSINGNNISNDELCRITEFVKPFADSMTSDPPTEFELITAIAFKYFADNNCDIVVLEAGMGGELDSTNVIDPPECAVICNIGLDHMSYLGNTEEEIAATKAGIIKPTSDLVLYDAKDSVKQVIQQKCSLCGVTLAEACFENIKNVKYTSEGTFFDYGHLNGLCLNLFGTYQPYNASLAVKCALTLRSRGWNIPDAAIFDGLKKVVWQGRFELLGQNPAFILDGSHNPQGLLATMDSFKQYFPGKKIKLLLGVMADKDVDTMLDLLLPIAHSFIAVKPNNPRALDEKELCAMLEKKGALAKHAPSVKQGVQMLLDRAEKTDVCAAIGSLYFSGDVRHAYNEAVGK